MKTLEITLPNKERMLLVEMSVDAIINNQSDLGWLVKDYLNIKTLVLGIYSKELGINFGEKVLPKWVCYQNTPETQIITNKDSISAIRGSEQLDTGTKMYFFIKNQVEAKGHSEVKKWAVILIKE